MKHFIESPLFECVREGIRTSTEPTIEAMVAHYDDFASSFIKSVEMEKSPLVLFRTLRLIQVEIHSLQKWIEGENFASQSKLAMLLWKVRERVRIELEIVRYRIRQHGLVPPSADAAGDLPAVFWSKKHTVTDLMELILALHASGAIVFRDGTNASVATLVRLSERTLNVKIKDPRGLRSNLTLRKIRTTKFLDTLLNYFVNLCNS